MRDKHCDCEYTRYDADLGSISDKEAARLSDFYKAFSDPSRLRIIAALLSDVLCVHDICRITRMEQSAASHKLAYLKKLRIVKPKRQGKSVFYTLDDDHVRLILTMGIAHIAHTVNSGEEK